MSLRRTTTGAAWLVGARFCTRVIDFAGMLVLARILTPADFGLVATAMTLILLVEAVLELPLAQALVCQAELRERHFDTAFTLGLLRGVAVAAIFALLAIPASRFFGDDRLILLIPVLSLAPALRGLASPRMALLFRDIRFHQEFAIGLAAKSLAFASAAAVALGTGSYWALVVGTLIAPLATTIGSYVVAPYRPRVSLSEWRSFADLLGWVTAAQLLTAINWQSDRILLARFVPVAALGQFTLANDVANLPDQTVLKSSERPLMAAFARIAHDPARLRQAYRTSTVALVTAGLPVMLALSLYAYPIVDLLLGAKWADAAPILQMLALTPIAALFVFPLRPLAMATGRTRMFAQQSAIELCLKVPAMAMAAAWYGVAGVVAVRLFMSVAMLMVSLGFVRTLTGLSPMDELTRPWRALVAGGVMIVVTMPLLGWIGADADATLLLRLGIAGVVSCVCYLVALLTLWHVTGRSNGPEALLVDFAERAWRHLVIRLRLSLHDDRPAFAHRKDAE